MSGEELASADTSPGRILREAREAIGVSQREVSDALNLPLHTVAAIEGDDSERLPAYVFTRGYVRAYAKLLEIDPDPLIAALDLEHASDPEPVVTDTPDVTQASGPSLSISTSNLAVAGGGLLGFIIVVALVFTAFGGDDESPQVELAREQSAPAVAVENTTPETGAESTTGFAESDAESPAEESVARATATPVEPVAEAPPEVIDQPLAAREPAPERAESRADVPDRAEPEENEPQGRTDPLRAPIAQVAEPRPQSRESRPELRREPREEEPAEEVALQSESETPVAAVPSEQRSPTRVRRITESGSDRLALEFSADCWVEIKDTDDLPLFADLGRAGQSLAFVGQGPFAVRLGYAPGVFMTYNSEAVALRPHTRRDDVANVVVGP